jgi:hypothetical protein
MSIGCRVVRVATTGTHARAQAMATIGWQRV